MARQTGETTSQMWSAPPAAVFVWCNPHLDYPQLLAGHVGRSDLEIVSPSWLETDRWRGRNVSGVVIDHATDLSVSQQIALRRVLQRIQS